MKKMTFKVTNKIEGNIASLLKEINKISCRMQIDMENNLVIVKNIDDTMIDTVLELINKNYTILVVNIDNTDCETVSVDDSKEVLIANKSDSTIYEKDTIEPATHPATVGPLSEDDLIIEKVEFRDEYIEDLINRLLKSVYWAMYKKHFSAKFIGEFIISCACEISMRCNNDIECIKYNIGDVVNCNYGNHLKGETNGGHTCAIICNISTNNMVYLVPIYMSWQSVPSYSTSYNSVQFNIPEDIIIDMEYYSNYVNLYNKFYGIALLDSGKYVNAKRFNAVAGKVTPKFFSKVLRQLKTTFDFTKNTIFDETDIYTGTDLEEFVETENVTESSSEDVINKVDKPHSKSESADTLETAMVEMKPKKISSVEDVLLEAIGASLDKLDTTKEVEEQIEAFLADIGMTTTERMITQSFVIACRIQKINYDSITFNLRHRFPKVTENIIEYTLKSNFKEWLKKYPNVKKSCPKISFMSLLKVFAKKFA